MLLDHGACMPTAQAHEQALEADLVLWTAGSGPATTSDAPAASGRLALPFPADRRGAIETDTTLRVVGARVPRWP